MGAMNEPSAGQAARSKCVGNPQAVNLATIRIKNLRLRCFIGIKEEEINNRQDVVINITLNTDVSSAVKDNDIASALNYRTICKETIALVDNQRFALLEKMTHDVLAVVMAHSGVLRATVEIDKVGALRYSDSVSMEQTGLRNPGETEWRALS